MLLSSIDAEAFYLLIATKPAMIRRIISFGSRAVWLQDDCLGGHRGAGVLERL